MTFDPQQLGRIEEAVNFLKTKVSINDEKIDILSEKVNQTNLLLAPLVQTVQNHDDEIKQIKKDWKSIAAMVIAAVGLSGNEPLRKFLGL